MATQLFVMRVLLKGHYGFGNFGDDALMIVSYQIIRELLPAADVTVFSNFTENLQGYNRAERYNQYIHGLLSGQVETIDWTFAGHFDLVLNGGGGLYFDESTGSFAHTVRNAIVRWLGVNTVRKTEKLLRLIVGRKPRLTFAKRVGIGIGIGEFKNSSPSFLSKVLELDSYNALFVRDQHSVQQLEKFKFRGKKLVFSDLVFLRRYWMRGNLQRDRPSVKTIGVIMMDMMNNGVCYEELTMFESKAAQKGLVVKHFSFDENHDVRLIDRFQDQIKVWRPNSVQFENFLRELATCDIVISARAHGAIIGACLGAIPICVLISKKLEEVAKMFPNSAQTTNLQFKAGELMYLVECIASDWKEFQNHLHHDVLENERSMMLALQVLQKEIESN